MASLYEGILSLLIPNWDKKLHKENEVFLSHRSGWSCKKALNCSQIGIYIKTRKSLQSSTSKCRWTFVQIPMEDFVEKMCLARITSFPILCVFWQWACKIIKHHFRWFLQVAIQWCWSIFSTFTSRYHMKAITVAMHATDKPQKQISTPPFVYLREIFVINFGWSVVKVLTASLSINSK